MSPNARNTCGSAAPLAAPGLSFVLLLLFAQEILVGWPELRNGIYVLQA